MRPPKITSMPYPWKRRFYFIGFLTCVLGLVGIGALLLMSDNAPEAWLTQGLPFDEEHSGVAGGRVRLSPDAFSKGALHNEKTRQLDADAREEEPSSEASSSVVSSSVGSATARLDPSNTPALRRGAFSQQAAYGPPPKPGPARRAAVVSDAPTHAQPALSESGVGEITILALEPGVRVNVADYVITEAPATLRVPWPAHYEVAVHLGDTTIYETQVLLTAENNRFSFAVNSEADVQ